MDDDKVYLREWRIFAGLTQEELGRRLGITGAQVSRLETGARDWDGRYLKQFKAVINKALDDMPKEGMQTLTRINHIGHAICVNPNAADLVPIDSVLHHKWQNLILDLHEQIANSIETRRKLLPDGTK